MYIFKNCDLKKDFPFLIQEANNRLPNDPNQAALIRIAQDLLFLDKRATLDIIQSIQEYQTDMMLYAISARCWIRFPHKSFMEALKKEIDRFKTDPNYKRLLVLYEEGLTHLEELEVEKRKRRERSQKDN
ncbi:MAG: hypothetical protein RL329_1681 [Bacteroidota bacterium]